MFKFFINLFKNKNKKKVVLSGMDIEIDKKKGTMIIKTSEKLTEYQIKKLFEKYVLGED